MRAMRNNKCRVVLIFTAILLLQVISGFPLEQTNSVGYVSTDGKQKKFSVAAEQSKNSVNLNHYDPSVETSVNNASKKYGDADDSGSSISEDLQNNKSEESKAQSVRRSKEEEIEGYVKQIIHEKSGVPHEDITPDSHFEDFGRGSYEWAEMAMACERKFRIDIPNEEFGNLRTVGSFIDYVSQQSK